MHAAERHRAHTMDNIENVAVAESGDPLTKRISLSPEGKASKHVDFLLPDELSPMSSR